MSASYRIEMPHWPKPTRQPTVGTPIERTQILLDKLGNPEKALPPTIHVAGTNGKGSTIAFLKSIFQAAGYSSHCYISPHIQRFTERITLANRVIDQRTVDNAIERTRLAANNMDVTFYEGTTAAAFLAFSETPADVLLLETGLGGRDDPTNVVPNKRLTILTTVSYDHMDVLGSTLERVALHKLGILRPDVPCISSYQLNNVQPLIESYANQHGVPLYSYGREWDISRCPDGFIYEDQEEELTLPQPGLLGEHQLLNAGSAIAAVRMLDEYNIPGEALSTGIEAVKHKGRLERISSARHQLSESIEIWFDGGHNVAGSCAMVETIRSWNKKPLYLICGTTRGKALAELLLPFKGKVVEMYGIPVAAEPMCYSADAIVHAAQHAGLSAQQAPDVKAAIQLIAEKEEEARILVFGSLYLRIEL